MATPPQQTPAVWYVGMVDKQKPVAANDRPTTEERVDRYPRNPKDTTAQAESRVYDLD